MMPDAHFATGADRSATRHVFVYGTLRAGEANDINRLRPRPQRVGEARIAGRLVDLGDYPGLLPDAGRTVLGEVYAIAPELEPVLDLIEGLDLGAAAEYERGEVEVVAGEHAFVCLVYWLRPRCALGRPLVEGGDWVRHRKLRDTKN